MRVCLICEGSYPYVPGGVSSWIQTLITNFKDIEFVIWAIGTHRDEMSQYAYKLPQNVTNVQTYYLGDNEYKHSHNNMRLMPDEKEALHQFVTGSPLSVDWKSILKVTQRRKGKIGDILSSRGFYDICLDEYKRIDSKKNFLHYLWNYRGIYFPLLNIFSQDVPNAAIYHSVSAGYAGALGSMASYVEDRPFILSEHGIYTREREEDIIRSQWVSGEFKELWIDFFKKLSTIAYNQASVVTTLFETNRQLQIELGCPPEKLKIIPNGVNPADFEEARGKKSDKGLTIGSILRVVPIKDVKTMLLAFDIVKREIPDAKLLLMGNTNENPTYYRECTELLSELGTKDIEFLGQVNIKRYLPKIDLLLLSSISEGQPLAILEGFAAEIPFIATNVGDCKDLINGVRKDDNFGAAGYIIPVMNSEAMADAIIRAAKDKNKLQAMGEAGRKRVGAYYTRNDMLSAYRELYTQLGGSVIGGDRV